MHVLTSLPTYLSIYLPIYSTGPLIPDDSSDDSDTGSGPGGHAGGDRDDMEDVSGNTKGSIPPSVLSRLEKALGKYG